MHLEGRCHAQFAFDIGREVDFERARRRLESAAPPRAFQHRRGVAVGKGSLEGALRYVQVVAPEVVGLHQTAVEVEFALYEFGAVSVTWRIPFRATLDELIALSVELYANEKLLARSRAMCEQLLAQLADAVEKPGISDLVEDYVLFHVSSPANAVDLVVEQPQEIARLLRAEPGPLAEQEVANALAAPVRYRPEEICLVDWLTALFIGREMSDELAVLEFATIELLELRFLEDQLGEGIERSYAQFAHGRQWRASLASHGEDLERIAGMQADGAALHEGVDNALKLFGDDYLARLYRAASERFHFADWDAAIRRKLETLDSAYQKLAEGAGRRRAEILEWLIILLIAVDIVLVLFARD